MGRWIALSWVLLAGIFAPAALAQVPVPVEADTPARTPRSPSRPAPSRPAVVDPRFAVVRTFLEQLDRSRWPAGLLTAEFRDEVNNEFAAGTAAFLAPGTLGKLKGWHHRRGAPYDFEVERTAADGTPLPPLRLRLLRVVSQWYIDGFDPAGMVRPERHRFRQDTALPTSDNRLFNTARLLKLPPLGLAQQEQAGQLVKQLYLELDSSNRQFSQLRRWFGPRLQAIFPDETALDRILIPGNLGTLRVWSDTPGSNQIRILLQDREGMSFTGAAFLVVEKGQLMIDALGYYAIENGGEP